MVFSIPTWLQHVESFREGIMFIYTSSTESLHAFWNLTVIRVGGGKGGERVYGAEEQGNSFLYNILGISSDEVQTVACKQDKYCQSTHLSAPTSFGQSILHAVLGFFKIAQVLLGCERSSFPSLVAYLHFRKSVKTSLIIYESHADGWMQILLSPPIDRGLHCYNGETC